eukprot:m.40730 g.40730  ORF g.40730 m.40730 type:complete len:157 (-) comp6017_c0_seq2:3124-3594(-)
MSELQHGLVADSDLERVRELEKEGYHEDEAATLEMIRMRHGEAGDLFTGAWKDGVLIGFTNSTRTNGNTLTHDSMHHNDPNGVNICLHSVCVAKDHRRQGVARAMLRHLLGLQKFPFQKKVATHSALCEPTNKPPQSTPRRSPPSRAPCTCCPTST